ncbi:MAG: GC-type dockerin domain-anchored protein [Planctomycetota bacterium]
MDTGVVSALSAMLVAGSAVAQPMEVIARQAPSPGVSGEVSQRITGGQTIEPARELVEDFIADADGTLRVVRLFAEPTPNLYGLRVRVFALDGSDAIAAPLGVVVGGAARFEVSGASGAAGFVVYDVAFPGGIAIERGARYGVEAVGLLKSPTLGDASRAWRWSGAEGDGGVFINENGSLSALDVPGVAFEVLGEVDRAECLADVNADGRLTPNDFNAWVLAFNDQDPRADQNGDGRITPGDFNAWLLNYNAGC